MPDSPPQLRTADAAFVTDHLLVGGDLDTRDEQLAASQLHELVEAGVTHVIDARVEWSDEQWVAQLAPRVAYLHHGMDDAGQRVPAEWFEVAVGWADEALAQGGTVLAHCHMGVNRGPSLGLAVLLSQGWDLLDALDAVRRARPVAWIAYAEDVLRWHHQRPDTPSRPGALEDDLIRLARWREDNELDLTEVIRAKRSQGY